VLEIQEAGLTVLVPAECGGSRTIEPGSNGTTLQILPTDIARGWSIKIRAPRVSNPELTAEKCADEALELLRTRLSGSDLGAGLTEKPASDLRVLSRVPNAQDSRKQLMGGKRRKVEFVRWYAQAPQGNGLSDVVRGLVVAKLSTTQFLTFDLTTTERDFVEAKRVFEQVVMAAELRPTDDVNMQRRVAIQTGMNLKKAVADADIQAIITAKPERWFRWYTPSTSGRKIDDTEVGYVRYQFSMGQRGEVDRKKPKSEWLATDRETGTLALSDTRMLHGNMVIDAQSGYFLRKDRAAEFWVNETGRRDLSKPQSPADLFTEMGAREGQDMQVEVSSSISASETIRPIMRNTDEYLSRVEAMLIPQLIVRAKAEVEYAYYTWNPEIGKILLRCDVVERSTDDPSRWRIKTRWGDGEISQTSLYEENGDLVRTELVSGTVIEPSSYEELLKLWSDKRLPIGSLDPKRK
jgi:hypothetical protein